MLYTIQCKVYWYLKICPKPDPLLNGFNLIFTDFLDCQQKKRLEPGELYFLNDTRILCAHIKPQRVPPHFFSDLLPQLNF